MVFVQTIRPMLATVRMHPMLVTHSRDHEKSSARWRKMELHDVIVETSKFALVSQEAVREEEDCSEDEMVQGKFCLISRGLLSTFCID